MMMVESFENVMMMKHLMIKNWKNHCGLRIIFAFADWRPTAISS